MSKNIILCSDGTNNKGGIGHPTNVWKIFNSVDLQSYKVRGSIQPEQVAFYDDGVGTDRLKLLKLLGGAFGWGLTRNVKDLYRHLAKNFERGDHIYLFGFSRGAFTVRTLAGFITKCGIISASSCRDKKELDGLIDHAYDCYRLDYKKRLFDIIMVLWRLIRRRPKPVNAATFRKTHGVVCDPLDYRHYREASKWSEELAEQRKIPIRFMGVWDTVDAVGFPLPWMARFWNNAIYHFKFPDYILNPLVDKACHALSIDDERKTFHPLVFEEKHESDADDPRVEQVWFPGVHSNVGGGYPKQGLASVTLAWIVKKAGDCGLALESDALTGIHRDRNIQDKLYDSRAGAAFFYRYKPRDIAAICERSHARRIRIHVGTFQRIARRTDGYAPCKIPRCAFHIIPDDPQNLGESPRQLASISRDVKNHLNSAVDEMTTIDKIITRRVWAYYLIALGALAVLLCGFILRLRSGGVLRSPPVSNDFQTVLQKLLWLVPRAGSYVYEYLVNPVLTHPWLFASLIGVVVLSYLADSWLKNRMRNLLCTVWWRAIKGPWW